MKSNRESTQTRTSSTSDGWAISVAVMNRNSMLRQTLPTWLKCEAVAEIVVVDWSSTELVQDVVEEFQDGRVMMARVEGQTCFSQSKTKNLKVRLCSHEQVFCVDADIKILRSDFLTECGLAEGEYVHGHWSDQRHTTGCLLIRKRDFLGVNGCNEDLVGWGYEDEDLYERLDRNGLHARRIPENRANLFHIPHSDADRVESFAELGLKEEGLLACREENRTKTLQRPWGAGDTMERFRVELFRPDGVQEIITV